MAGKFTVAVDNKGQLAAPFNTGGALDFIDKNNIATDAEVDTAKQTAIDAAAADATLKADKALEDANTYTDSEITKLDIGAYAKTSEVTAAISTSEETIQGKLDDKVETSVYEAKVTELADDIADAESNARAYTDVEVKKVADELDAVKTFSIKVVNKLPETGEEKVIYLVPATDTEDKNVNDEFLYIDGKWEQIGTTAINLEPIYTELEELKNMMPEVIPNLNILPTITMTSNKVSNGSLYCVGEEVEFGTITTNFNSGKIDPQGQSESPYRCGALTSVSYSGSGWGHTNETSLPTEIKQSYSFTNTISKYKVSNTSTISWTVAASYDEGKQPVSNKGKNYGEPLPAGTKTATLSITGTYPFFATTSSITSTTKQSLVKLDTTSIKTAMAGCTDKNFWVLEVPACWTITNVTGAASGQLGGNATNAVAQWTRTNIVKTIQDNNIKYYRYAYGANNAPKKGADTLTFSIKYDNKISLSTSLAEGVTWE